jgi:hypothetical protein
MPDPTRPSLAGTVLTTADLAAARMSPQTRRTLLTHGCLTAPVSGIYAPKQPGERCENVRHRRPLALFRELPVDPQIPDALRACVLRSVCLARRHGPEAVVSGPGAAALWGFPIVLDGSSPVPSAELTCPTGRVSHKKGDQQHPVAVGKDDVRTSGGIAITSPARTLVDVAAHHSLVTAMVIADHVLSHRILGRADIERAFGGHPSCCAQDVELPVASFASALAESPGESWCRVELYRAGLPTPIEQVSILDVNRQFIGRVDFAWPEFGIVLEFDGAVKYEANGSKALVAEKKREDRLRESGWTVVRCVWADLYRFDHVAAEIRRAIAREPTRPRGTAFDRAGTSVF